MSGRLALFVVVHLAAVAGLTTLAVAVGSGQVMPPVPTPPRALLASGGTAATPAASVQAATPAAPVPPHWLALAAQGEQSGRGTAPTEPHRLVD